MQESCSSTKHSQLKLFPPPAPAFGWRPLNPPASPQSHAWQCQDRPGGGQEGFFLLHHLGFWEHFDPVGNLGVQSPAGSSFGVCRRSGCESDGWVPSLRAVEGVCCLSLGKGQVLAEKRVSCELVSHMSSHPLASRGQDLLPIPAAGYAQGSPRAFLEVSAA